MAVDQRINYSGYVEDCSIVRQQDKRLDNTLKFCKAIGITYAEFQRREYFGIIPQSVKNILHQNKEVSQAYIDKYFDALKRGDRHVGSYL